MKPKFLWSNGDKQEKLPVGLAAFAALCVGWVGAVLCMAQVYLVAPITKLVGEHRVDMGHYVAVAWAGWCFFSSGIRS